MIDHLLFNSKTWRNFDNSNLIGIHKIEAYAAAGGYYGAFVFSISQDGKISVDVSKSFVANGISEGTLKLDGKLLN